ncbi:uncharacterized protein [Dermacentor albipictus]|uniref:uncharacterized protein n=1 Tax=Dermacentor albipictus TaxID=60249 RepID=UPI0038FCAD57
MRAVPFSFASADDQRHASAKQSPPSVTASSRSVDSVACLGPRSRRGRCISEQRGAAQLPAAVVHSATTKRLHIVCTWKEAIGGRREPEREQPACEQPPGQAVAFSQRRRQRKHVHRRKHPECVHNPRETQRCKMQARRTKAISDKLKNGTSGDQQQQASFLMAVAHDRGTPEFQKQQHPPPPPQRNERRATSGARRSDSGAAKVITRPRPSATVADAASARSAARPYNVPWFPGHLPGLLGNQLSPTFLDDEDDDLFAGTPSFDQGGILDTLGSAVGAPGEEEEEARRSIGSDLRTAPALDTLGSPDVDAGECEPSPSASRQHTTNSARLRSIPRRRSLPAAEASTALPALAPDPGVEGASQSSEVHHSYQLRSRTRRPPNTFMLVAHGKRQSVAAENPNVNNRRVNSRLGKMWRSLSVADKQPYQRKPAASADVHRRKHPECVHNPRETQRCKMQALRTKAISGKLKNGASGDQQQQASISMTVVQDRGIPEFQQQQQHPPPPPERNEWRATSAARRSDSGAAKLITRPRPSATVAATASARSAARPYNVPWFPGHLPPLVREANRTNAVPTTHLRAARAFKQLKTPCARSKLGNQLSPTFLDDEDDDLFAGTPSFDQGGIRETLGSAVGAPGEGQPWSPAAGCIAA